MCDIFDVLLLEIVFVEFLNFVVMMLNIFRYWRLGTQFGMLIAYLKELYPIIVRICSILRNASSTHVKIPSKLGKSELLVVRYLSKFNEVITEVIESL